MTRQDKASTYKDFTPVMGIWRVTHRPSGRSLIGASEHAQGMLNRIRFQLDAGMHRQHPTLQTDWKNGQPGDFQFEILDELKPQAGKDPQDDLKELLALWQEKLSVPEGLRY